MNDLIAKLVIQYGFAGFCAAQFIFIFWLVRRLLSVLEKNNQVIQENTAAVRDMAGLCGDVIESNKQLREKIITRPCIARGEG